MANISAKSYFLTNAKSTVLRVGVSSISTLFIIPFIIQEIGIKSYSYISITSFFVAFAGMLDLGVEKALVFLINTQQSKNNDVDKIITAGKIINTTLLIVISILSVFLWLGDYNVLGDSLPKSDPYFNIVVFCSFIILILTVYNMFQNALLEGFFFLEYANYGTMLKIMVMNVLYVLNLFTFNNLWFYILSPLLSLCIAIIYLDLKINKHISYVYTLPDKEIFKRVCSKSFDFMKIGLMTSLNSFLPRFIIIYLSPTIEYVGILDVINKITFSIINFFSTISRPIYSLARVQAKSLKKKLLKIEIIYLFAGIIFLSGIYICRDFIIQYFFADGSLTINTITYLLLLYSFAAMLYLIGQPLSLYLMGVGRNDKVFSTLILSLTCFVTAFVSLSLTFSMDILFNLAFANLVLSIVYCWLLFINYKKC